MNTNTAFKALTAIRKARSNQGGYSVFAITKSGAPSKVATRDVSGRFEFDLEQALKVKENMERNNPGRTWVVLAA